MKKIYIYIAAIICIIIGITLALFDKQNQDTRPIPPRNDTVIFE